jgi:hypothetical protein
MSVKPGKWGKDESDSSLEEFGFSGFTPTNPEPTQKAPELSVPTRTKLPSSYSPDDIPPYVNYDKLYKELGDYNFQITRDCQIAEIREYLETIQKFRSRLITLEQEAERHYSSLNMTYDILSAYELLQRIEKTAKEKEAGVLIKLKKWAEAAEDAKIYASTCKKYREQLDTTHHLLTKILSTMDLEVKLKGYKNPPPDSGNGDSWGKGPTEGSW